MTQAASITIIGGGLAGLSLGIALRRRDVRVTLWEAERYPRHRVCGEFISGRGQEVFKVLNLGEALVERGAILARKCAFFSHSAFLGGRRLPQPAVCLSRFELDALLADEFRRAGGELNEGKRRKETAEGDGVVRATGRRPRTGGARRWFGLKAHAAGVRLAADLEMHFDQGGYVGLCRVENDRVNVCGLFRSDGPVSGLARHWPEWLRGRAGSVLRARLDGAEFLPESFCSVAGLDFAPGRAAGPSECRVGDAISLIAPVTGNGLSMALESSQAAVEPLVAFSRGKLTWAGAREAVGLECDRRFGRRLRWAAFLQNRLFAPGGGTLLRLAFACPGVWQLFFRRTR